MRAHYKCPVYKITQYKDGCVYKTQKVNDVWLDIKARDKIEENAIAQLHGGDILASPRPDDYCFALKCEHVVWEE